MLGKLGGLLKKQPSSVPEEETDLQRPKQEATAQAQLAGSTAADPAQSQTWLNAHFDPVAGLNAFTGHMQTCDLYGDGDWRLAVADLSQQLKVCWAMAHIVTGGTVCCISTYCPLPVCPADGQSATASASWHGTAHHFSSTDFCCFQPAWLPAGVHRGSGCCRGVAVDIAMCEQAWSACRFTRAFRWQLSCSCPRCQVQLPAFTQTHSSHAFQSWQSLAGARC